MADLTDPAAQPHYPGFVRLQLYSGPQPDLVEQADPSRYLGTFYLSPRVFSQEPSHPAPEAAPESHHQDQPAGKPLHSADPRSGE